MEMETPQKDVTMEAAYETLDQDEDGAPGGPAKSVEGWIVIVTGLIGEAQEEDVYTAFEEFGEIKNMHLNLDRRTGFVKGYSLVEFAEKSAAKKSVQKMNGAMVLGSEVTVDWAFTKGARR